MVQTAQQFYNKLVHVTVGKMGIKKINAKKYPNALKLDFKGDKIHGDFVRRDSAFKNYLIGKCLYDRGYRKRLYCKSFNFKTIKTNKN